MNKDEMRVHVGQDLEDSGHRFVDAWKRMERGEGINEHHVSFEDWETMVRVLSPKRLALLRHVHAFPAKNVRVLAQALGRDYRRVHDDVMALATAGLLERDADGLRAGYDAFELRMNVAL